jgi:uncharacterized protein YcbK (DUF882 family)
LCQLWFMLKYFNYHEFDSPDVQGSGQLMDKRLLEMLDLARDKYGKPIRVNSGYRTPQHNQSIGSTSKSSHLRGLAVDLHCNNSIDRHELLWCLQDVGFKRIGIADTFIHVDIDTEKVQNVIWLYV